MNVGVIGARGNIGQRIVAEASARGHHVTAFTRSQAAIPEGGGKVVWRTLDVLDAESVSAAIDGLDVLVNSYGPGNASENLQDAIEQSISNPQTYSLAARALLTALERHPTVRLIVVGGAGSLEIAPGHQAVDAPGMEARLEQIGIPPAYKVAVLAHREALNVYRQSNRNWTYLSPPAEIRAGERTGRFRLGENQMLFDAEGRSRISYEDLAVAVIDEIVLPRHVQRRFTAAY
jgi:uncharacterized protein